MNYSHFNDLAIEYGFAVCYPQGINYCGTFFNVGYDFQNNETVDDVAYLENLTAYLQADNLSADKTFASGMSNGGDFCYLLACEASESFLGVAPNIRDDYARYHEQLQSFSKCGHPRDTWNTRQCHLLQWRL